MHKKSVLWRVPDSIILSKYYESDTVVKFMSLLGFPDKGDNRKTLNSRISVLGLSLSSLKETHIAESTDSGDSEDLFVENYKNKIHGQRLKKKMINLKGVKEECFKCKQHPVWNGKPLTLQLDHINGIRNDNRLENLRLLCPNCHSQTPTYAGRNQTKLKVCKECYYIYKGGHSKYCSKECKDKRLHADRKCLRVFDPTKEEMQYLVYKYPICEIGRMFRVSDVVVHRRCKELGVNKPPAGYWLKKENKRIAF